MKLCLVAACLQAGFVFASDFLQTHFLDPRMMNLGLQDTQYSGGANTDFYGGYFPGGHPAFSFTMWARMETNFPGMLGISSYMFLSAHDARPTDQGGAQLHNSGPMGDWTNVILSSSGTWACPQAVNSPRDTSRDEYPEDEKSIFSHGVWCLNVISNSSPITLLLAGTEYQIPATNFYVRNILGSADDPSVSVSGAPGASFRLGIGELVPIKFYVRINGVVDSGKLIMTAASTITNEWTMISYRACVSNNLVYTRDDFLRWNHEKPTGKNEILGKTTATVFEKGFQVIFGARGMANVATPKWGVYGPKFFTRWLSDDELETIRDLDEEEMKRRGFSQFF